MSNIQLTCAICNNEFSYYKGEYNRQVKKGRTEFYCSISCAGKRKSNVDLLKRVGKKFVGGENRLVIEDDFIKSSMNDFLRRIRYRKKVKDRFAYSDVTIEHLIEVWEKQKGRCAYTNVPLVLPSYKEYKTANYNYKASIDRIDSTVGYKSGNIQFISYTMNNLKSDMTEDQVYEFILLLKKCGRISS